RAHAGGEISLPQFNQHCAAAHFSGIPIGASVRPTETVSAIPSQTGHSMDGSELQQIEQRIKEGYYEADADALCVMRRLLAEVRRFREEALAAAPEMLI
ncbi:MAG: hypothetical protein ACXWI6_22710, partial [Burkholderiales bacterium]